jgi:predicted Zn finger-like uncharacterized protein
MRVYCPECEHGFRVAGDETDRRVRCPKCGEKFHVDEGDEEDEPRPKPKKRPAAKADNSKTVLILVLVGVATLVVVGGGAAAGVVVALAEMDAAKTTARTPAVTPLPDPAAEDPFYRPAPAPAPPPATWTTPATAPQGGGPVTATTAPTPRPNPSNPPADPLDALFREPVDKPPLVLKVGVLARKPEEPPLTVPTFHSLMVANKLVKPTPQSKLTLEEVKAATVYVKVDAGDLSGSGSGFYIGAENGAALVATNHHVIEAAAKRPEPGAAKAKVTCVFHSGVPADERPTTATIVAIDPIADLAVLRLDNPPAKLPKPINPWATPKLTETMDVRICGFPFGEQLATATTNPNISVNNGTVSSLRLNKTGGLDKVQISGAINPGNSGGPIVDKDGRLVGVAVSTIKGSGLGFAVPVDDLIGLLEGKILVTELVPVGLTDKAAKFRVRVLVMDPRGRVDKVYVRFWAGNGLKPRAVKDAQYGHKPIENGLEFALKLPVVGSSLTGAEGDLEVPADATSVVLQLGSEQVAGPGQPRGLLSISAPVEYTLSTKELPHGSDAKPLGETFRDPAALAGQTVVVRGKVVKPPSAAGKSNEMTVADTAGRVPARVKFLAAREVAVQFDEIDPEVHGNDVRVVCVVGQKGADGVTPVRVARCDFLEDEGDVVVRSVPEADTKDQLAAANRDPAKFADKGVTFTGVAVILPARPLPKDDFLMLFDNLGRPRSLTFAYAPGLGKRVNDGRVKPNGLYKVRMTAKVDAAATTTGTVTVSKVEILDPTDDSVQRVIE